MSQAALDFVIQACSSVHDAAEMLADSYGITLRFAKTRIRSEGGYESSGTWKPELATVDKTANLAAASRHREKKRKAEGKGKIHSRKRPRADSESVSESVCKGTEEEGEATPNESLDESSDEEPVRKRQGKSRGNKQQAGSDESYHPDSDDDL